jgi:hypothetical protein
MRVPPELAHCAVGFTYRVAMVARTRKIRICKRKPSVRLIPQHIHAALKGSM